MFIKTFGLDKYIYHICVALINSRNEVNVFSAYYQSYIYIFFNMVFIDYMKSLPNQQQDTVKKLAELTFTSPSTVYRWISGEIVPPMIKKKIIAEYLGKSVEELFPNNQN